MSNPYEPPATATETLKPRTPPAAQILITILVFSTWLFANAFWVTRKRIYRNETTIEKLADMYFDERRAHREIEERYEKLINETEGDG